MLKYYYLCLIPLTVLEARKFKIKMLAYSVSGNDVPPGSQKVVFLQCPYMAKGIEFSEVS